MSFRRLQWRVLFATMFCYFFFYTGRQSFGFAIPGIQQELGLSKEALGWASAALLWSYAIGQAINGNVGDKLGGRMMMTSGALLSCALTWVTSFATSFRTLAVPWGLNGFAQSMGWAPGSRVLSNWWGPRERGRTYGYYVFSAGMSSVLTFGLCTLLVQSGADWRWIFRLPVLLLILGAIVYFALVRNRPEDFGFTPPTDAGTVAIELERETSLERYKAVLGNGRFLLASAAIGFQSLARYALLIWVPVHLLGTQWKTSPDNVLWLSMALPTGMALGALANGWISDRFFGGNRSRAITLFMVLAAAAALTMYVLPQAHPAALPMMFLTGSFAYGPQSAFWALCPDLLGAKRAGTGTGVMNAAAYLVAGLGEPAIGAAIERNDDTGLVFAIVAGACLLSALIAATIRR